MTRRRAWICWGLIAGSWIVETAVGILAHVPRPEIAVPPRATPPAWAVAAACVVACLLVAAAASRRVRACLRVRPRLSRPSVHGDAYLEAFTLCAVLDVAVLLAVGVLIRMAIRHAWSDRTWTIVLMFAGRLPDAAAIAYAFARARSVRAPLAEWGWKRGGGALRELSVGVLTGILIWLVWQLRDAVVEPNDTSTFLGWSMASSVTLTPIFEETICRGALYRYLRDHMSWLPTVIFSSALFAAMHSASRMPHAYAAGLAYGLLREWRGSLVAPVAAHASWNALAIAACGGPFG